MRIAFRVDASLQIGSGHVMRCLTLAEGLRNKGADIVFVCREHEGHLNDLITKKGFSVVRLPMLSRSYAPVQGDVEHASWLGAQLDEDAEASSEVFCRIQPEMIIVDHYALDWRWEKKMRPFSRKIMVIDDLADRSHDCDLFLDQNPYKQKNTRYTHLLPDSCRKLIGADFALLRPEFLKVREEIEDIEDRNGIIKRIFVFFGGSDPTNETLKALKAIQLMELSEIETEVVVGIGNPHKKEIETLCKSIPNAQFFCQIDNMAERLRKADLAIGAGGATTLERCALGIPSLVIAVAQNQELLCNDLYRCGVHEFLGKSIDVSIEALKEGILHLIHNPSKLHLMERKSKKLVDCLGVNRVVDSISTEVVE